MWIARIRSHELTLNAGKIEFTLQTMLEFGADIYARLRGEPPLHYAFSQEPDFSDETRLNVQRHNLMETVKTLLKHGADIFALTDDGLSVLDIAKIYGWTTELYEAMQQIGCCLEGIRLKLELAQLIFYNSDGAFVESTAIDSSLNKPPSTAGLISRRALPGDRLED